MGFYEQIGKYYDIIFPIGIDQINFIKRFADGAPKKLLDIACGTGGYSLALSSEGYEVTAVDLDDRMIEELKLKASAQNLKINAIKGDMLTIGKDISSSYNLAFCIGNSLVHLDNLDEIQVFLTKTKTLLGETGTLIIQIINYDRILGKHITCLPTIENNEASLSFERRYRYDKLTNKIYFKTILQVNDQKIENEIPLYPLLSEELIIKLKNSGFKAIKLFGDFKETAYDPQNSYTLVIVAK